MSQPVTVLIKAEWRKQADDYAKATGYRSMRTGKVAEYAVIGYLRAEHVPLKEDATPVNRPDYFDINLGSTLVDVKSCLAPAQELRITRKHFDSGRRFAFYIGVQVNRSRNKARIYGFCTKDEVEKAKTRRVGRRLCYVLPFAALHPIRQLVTSFQRPL